MRTSPILFAVLVVMAAGCSPSGGGGNATAGPAAGLANTAWTVITLNGAPTLDGAKPTLAFAADGTVSGSAGCNQYQAMFQADGGSIRITNVTSTLMMCAGAFGQQEQVFMKALDGVSTWRLNEASQLAMAGGIAFVAGQGVAEGPPETPPVLDLPGTSWILTEMGGTADFAHLVPTLAFGNDGTVSGFSGCNRFHGIYTTDGRVVSLVSTKIGCQRPASEIEATYLDALSGVTSTNLVDGKLVIDGPIQLTFSPG